MSRIPKVRAALYGRVSTIGHGQDVGLQMDELRAVAAQRGWTTIEYVDDGVSGSKTSRPALDMMMADAKAGKFDLVVIWKLDRLARSVIHLVQMTESFQAWGVGLVSARDAHIDTTTASGRFTLHILGAVAELERELTRERVIAGVRRAQRQGKHCGRPRRDVPVEAAVSLLREGRSLRQVSKLVRLDRNTLRTRLREQGLWPVGGKATAQPGPTAG